MSCPNNSVFIYSEIASRLLDVRKRMMKAASLLRSPPKAPLVFPSYYYKPLGKFSHYRRSLSTNSTLSSISSSLTPPTSHEPRTPLFLRPLVYSSSVSDIQTFFNWARALANSVGSIFVQTDNGPDSTLLLRELRWFLEDTIEDTSLVSELGYSQNDARVVNLRASLEQMYELWNQRIKERKPFQYIVGCEHWRDLVLSVEEGVLIPRPETEKIVDLVGDLVRDNESLREGLWADLGTGSGALAIGIATILGRNGRVIATDVSPISLAVANFNVQRYGLQDVVEIKEGSWFDPLMHAEGELAGLVSNPPYIPSANISGLQAEVAKHEPRLALDGGFEGVDDLLYLCRMAARMLKSGGYFAFETNGGEQCELLASYIANEIGDSFQHVSIIPDFAGIMRFLTGFRI